MAVKVTFSIMCSLYTRPVRHAEQPVHYDLLISVENRQEKGQLLRHVLALIHCACWTLGISLLSDQVYLGSSAGELLLQQRRMLSYTPIYMRHIMRSAIQTLHKRLSCCATKYESHVVSRDLACPFGLNIENRSFLLLFDIGTIASILMQKSHPGIAPLSEQQWSTPPPPQTSPLRAAPRSPHLKRPQPRPAGSRTT